MNKKMQCLVKPFLSLKFEVIIDKCLEFTCADYGILLPDVHEIYKRHRRSVKDITLLYLLMEVSNFKLCDRLPTSIMDTQLHCLLCELGIGGKREAAKVYHRAND